MAKAWTMLRRHWRKIILPTLTATLFVLLIPIFARILGFAPIGSLKLMPESSGLKVSNDGRTIAALRDVLDPEGVCVGQWLDVWNVETGKLAWSVHAAPASDYRFGQVAISPNGQLLAVEMWRLDFVGILIYSIQTSQKQAEFESSRHWADSQLIFSPDSRMLGVVVGMPPRLRVWDLASQKRLLSVETRARDFFFAPNGNYLISAEEYMLWDTHTGRGFPIVRSDGTYLSQSNRAYESVVFASDSEEFVVSRWNVVRVTNEKAVFDIERFDCQTGRKKSSTICRGWDAYRCDAIIQRDGPADYSFLDLKSGRVTNMRIPENLGIVQNDTLQLFPTIHQESGCLVTRQDLYPATSLGSFLPVFNHFHAGDTGSYVLHDYTTGAHLGTIPDCRIAGFTGNAIMEAHEDGVVDVWSIPPRRPVPLILSLAALHTLLILAPCWYFARRSRGTAAAEGDAA